MYSTVNNEEKLIKSGFVPPNLKKDGKKEEFKIIKRIYACRTLI
jgi:hypothetical protein